MTDKQELTARQEWLQWRRQGVGASDVAGILGISPWASAWSVWADKVGVMPEQPENEYMEAGRWLEQAIGPWFTHKTGLHVAGEQTQTAHPDHPTHRATLDGLVFARHQRIYIDGGTTDPEFAHLGFGSHTLTDDPLGLLEIKTARAGKKWEFVPPHYQTQGQWQMHVTGLDKVWFAVLMGRRLDIHEMERNQAEINMMVERVDRFWSGHVKQGIPPRVDGSNATTNALRDYYDDTYTTTDYIEADSKTADIVFDWKVAKANSKTAEKAEKELANAVRAALGNATELVRHDQLIASWRPQTQRRLDLERIRAEHPILVDDFTAATEIRVLRAHHPKGKK